MDCGKTANRVQMPFGMVGRTGPRMRQVVGFGDLSTGRGNFGVNMGRPIETNGGNSTWQSMDQCGVERERRLHIGFGNIGCSNEKS